MHICIAFLAVLYITFEIESTPCRKAGGAFGETTKPAAAKLYAALSAIPTYM